jgi:hypothetical protein
MTIQRLHDLLYHCEDVKADSRLSEILDVLVTTTIIDDESTWSAPIEERILFGLGCILNHASHNGLDKMWSLCGEFEGSSAETMASAIEGLEIIGETEFLEHARAFWNHIITPALKAKIALPSKYSLAKRGDYAKAESIIVEAGVVLDLPDSICRNAHAFLCCWDTTFPLSVLNWIKTFEKQLAGRICRD